MTKTCLNCNEPLDGNFCKNCGQNAHLHRIDSHYLWHEIQHGFLHVDKGILFTSKALLFRPGHFIREFIGGKMGNHFKPISMIIILAAIFGIVSHYFHLNVLANNIKVTGSGVEFELLLAKIDTLVDWVAQHYIVLFLIQIPVFALGTFWAFKKANYNFFEHLVLNVYACAQRLLIKIIFLPVLIILKESNLFIIFSKISDVLGYLFFYWTLFQFFNKIPKLERFFRILLTIAISFPLIVAIFFIILQYFLLK